MCAEQLSASCETEAGHGISWQQRSTDEEGGTVRRGEQWIFVASQMGGWTVMDSDCSSNGLMGWGGQDSRALPQMDNPRDY